MKQRPRRKQGLVMALGALAGMGRADVIAIIMLAARAMGPFRPELLRQRLHAALFRSIAFLPIQQVGFHYSHDSISLCH